MTIYGVSLFIHIAFASLGLLSGFAALLAPKGGRVHAMAGQVFLPVMLLMATSALLLVFLRDAPISIVPSILTFYLVITGWRTVTRRSAVADATDIGLATLAAVGGVIGLVLGAEAAQTMTGKDKDGFPAMAYYIFGGVSLAAAALDVRMMLARGVRGAHRIARHLWRMGAALFIATTSFFQGQAKHFPQSVQGTFWLQLPVLIVVGMVGYWLLRLAVGGLRRRVLN